jgi:peptidoglycan hydrolase-like protein with peptidoglycan-binding domain
MLKALGAIQGSVNVYSAHPAHSGVSTCLPPEKQGKENGMFRGITGTSAVIVAAALATLSTTAASATPAAASAPGHVAAPQAARVAADPSGCVTEVFSTADESTYESCVADEQILLNNLWNANAGGPDQLLVVDGYYGAHTANDVKSFQTYSNLAVDGITGSQTWEVICNINEDEGFTGIFWHGAGCANESAQPQGNKGSTPTAPEGASP